MLHKRSCMHTDFKTSKGTLVLSCAAFLMAYVEQKIQIGVQPTVCSPFVCSVGVGVLFGNFYLSIYISTYIAPLQGNYSEALPAQARPKWRVLRSLYKELERSCGRERSSEGRPFQTEGPTYMYNKTLVYRTLVFRTSSFIEQQ